MEIEPIAPRLAGSRNTPEPIMEPVTTMLARNGPIFLCCRVEFIALPSYLDRITLQENHGRTWSKCALREARERGRMVVRAVELSSGEERLIAPVSTSPLW